MRKNLKRALMLIVMMGTFTATTAQHITTIKGDYIEQLKKNTSDTTYVINFWATWCKPCVAELPAFEKLNTKYKADKVKVILVSNDLKKQVDTQLKPFIAKHKLRSTVLF